VNHAAFASALGLSCAVVLLCAVVTLWRRSLRAIVRALALQGAALASVALIL
jgi:hydrogenase-4 membrane subunit HyfE